MQLWKCFLVGALVVLGLCSEAHSKPTTDAPATPDEEEYLMDEDDYNNEYAEDDGPSKENNQVQLTPPTMEKTWAVYNSSIGDRVTLYCPVKNKGDHSILWYRGDLLLAQERMVLERRYEVDSDFSLIIPNVMGSDEGDYTCKVLPSDLLSSCKLNVAQPPTVKITDGSRDVMDRTMTYREGEKIRLICDAHGFPRPTIQWDTKHHRLNDLAGVIVNKGDLIIENAEPQHSGIYECKAENENNQSTNASVHVVIEYVPKVLTHRPEINAAKGGHATLFCNYHSNPEGRVQWLRNGQVLEQGDKYSISSDKHLHTRHMKNNLNVKNIDMEDLGLYTCEVTNKLGSGNVNVSIMYEPEMAVFEGSELDTDGNTRLTWTVNSAQNLVEVDLYYKKSGDKQWRQVKPIDIQESSKTGVFSIVHKVKLSRGVWYTKLRTKNAFGASKMSAEHEVTVVTSEVQEAGILSFAKTSGSESISRTSLVMGCVPVIMAVFLGRL